MAWVTTQRIAIAGVLIGGSPLLLLIGRIFHAAFIQPAEPLAVLWDALVLSVGTLFVLGFTAMHLQSALTRPLGRVTEQLSIMAEGRFDDRVARAGPREVHEVAQAVNHLAQSFERRLHQVSQRSGVQAMGAVLQGVAHEIANPLAQMRLTAHLLMKEARRRGDARSAEGMERILRGIDRLAETVDTLRQAGGGKGTHRPERLVNAALIVAQQGLLDRHVDVHHGAEEALPCVPGDVVQALVCLLQNAAETPCRQVWIRSYEEGKKTVFEVADDGPGMPTAVAEHVGDPFLTTKPGHAGLGLPLAKRIAQEHGGVLRIGRGAQGGAAVAFVLPFQLPRQSADSP